MQEELKKCEVLAMYDVRGIQNYIFRTNRIKEIMGASSIVENIILEGFQHIIEELKLDKTQYIINWEDKSDAEYLSNPQIQMQVLFIGGGNAYVLYRKGEVCELFNKKLAKYVLEHTYSLQLAVAVIAKTDNYSEDYKKINARMREIKATMPNTRPMGAFPFMAVDSVIGFPLVAKNPNKDEGGYVCTESLLKRKKYKKDENASENILDNMVTKKGENSFLAIVHIDGNNMGKRIKKIMEKKTKYPEAIKAMRAISRNLKYSFLESFAKMGSYIDSRTDEIKPGYEGKLYRKLILAGDDITFICNAQIALEAVKVFLQDVSQKVMYQEEGLEESENLNKYGLSACGGIAFANSHFPFSDAYEVAEACCASAKKRAKEVENRDKGEKEGNIGNYIDFQICNHVKTIDLEEHREKNYQFVEQDGQIPNRQMIFRPYYVSCKKLDEIKGNDLNKRNSKYDFDNIFIHNIRCFQDNSKSRSKMKNLRNAFAFGLEEVKKEIVFLDSRQVKLPKENEIDTWYDALEMMDLCKLDGGE